MFAYRKKNANIYKVTDMELLPFEGKVSRINPEMTHFPGKA